MPALLSMGVINYGLTVFLDDLLSILLTVVQISIFLGQARSWPVLMVEWMKVEQRMRHFHRTINLRRNVYYYLIAFCLGTVGKYTFKGFSWLHISAHLWLVIFNGILKTFFYYKYFKNRWHETEQNRICFSVKNCTIIRTFAFIFCVYDKCIFTSVIFYLFN